MSPTEDPIQKPPGRLSPDELAGEVAKRLRTGRTERGEHVRRRFDIVTVSRIGMGVGIILIGIGALFAIAWIGRLAGYETAGVVIEETPVFGCPGEPEAGVLFSGETVQVVGTSEDGVWYAVRDERGPGDVVYADSLQIDAEGDLALLEPRVCEPRSAAVIAAEATTTSTANDDVLSTANSTTLAPVVLGETTTTVSGDDDDEASSPRPRRRAAPSPGTTTTTTTTTTTRPAPGSSSTTTPGSSSTTTRPGSTTSTTRPGSTSSTTAPSTTTSTTVPTTTTITTVTTTTEATTPTTETTTTVTTPTTTEDTTPPTTIP